MKAQFLTELHVRELPDGSHQLLQALMFYSAELADATPAGNGFLVVPAGVISDYASVPRGFWNTFPPGGPWRYAAVLHDAASHGEMLTEKGHRVHLVKHMTDRLFREAMTVPPCDAVPLWKRWLMYRLVKRWGTGVYGGPPQTPPEAA